MELENVIISIQGLSLGMSRDQVQELTGPAVHTIKHEDGATRCDFCRGQPMVIFDSNDRAIYIFGGQTLEYGGDTIGRKSGQPDLIVERLGLPIRVPEDIEDVVNAALTPEQLESFPIYWMYEAREGILRIKLDKSTRQCEHFSFGLHQYSPLIRQ